MRGSRFAQTVFVVALLVMSTAVQVRADKEYDGDDDDDAAKDVDDFSEYDVDAGNDTDDANDTSIEEEAVYDENGIIMTSDHTFRQVGYWFESWP